MAFTPEQFEKVNGYSNEYWGWGCEDDDMYIRVVSACLRLEQADYKYYPYDMLIRRFTHIFLLLGSCIFRRLRKRVQNWDDFSLQHGHARSRKALY